MFIHQDLPVFAGRTFFAAEWDFTIKGQNLSDLYIAILRQPGYNLFRETGDFDDSQ